MVTREFCRQLPKVELHVHLEGSVRPETVLKLAKRHGITLPADSLEGLQEWYTFRDFPHFVQIYVAISKCIKTAEDVELIAREFLEGQAEQNIYHSEVTYTACTIDKFNGISWPDQHQALLRAIKYGQEELGVSMGVILDIVRGDTVERAMQVLDWCTNAEGVVALGLAGEEVRGTAQYAEVFAEAKARGVTVIPHSGETVGPESIKEVLEFCNPKRIGHGVRCVEDLKLVKQLRDLQIPLEVCPSSNICLGVFKSIESHSLPQLLDEGLYVTINSDDPPMFNTTLSEEYFRCAEAFGFNEDILWSLSQNAVRASLLADDAKKELMAKMREEFNALMEN